MKALTLIGLLLSILLVISMIILVCRTTPTALTFSPPECEFFLSDKVQKIEAEYLWRERGFDVIAQALLIFTSISCVIALSRKVRGG